MAIHELMRYKNFQLNHMIVKTSSYQNTDRQETIAIEGYQGLFESFKKDEKVLIVDDDENTRDLLNKILKNEGYMSIDAKNGEDALERVKEKPDLIVLDLDMPKMDGFEFIERAQEDSINIPIVVFSGKDITAVEEKMLSKFTEGIVKKESKVKTLVNEVNQILKGEESK